MFFLTIIFIFTSLQKVREKRESEASIEKNDLFLPRIEIKIITTGMN